MDDATDGCKCHYALPLLKEQPGRSVNDLNVANTFSDCHCVETKKLGRSRNLSGTLSQTVNIAGYLLEMSTR
jgi:hypothetical protein